MNSVGEKKVKAVDSLVPAKRKKNESLITVVVLEESSIFNSQEDSFSPTTKANASLTTAVIEENNLNGNTQVERVVSTTTNPKLLFKMKETDKRKQNREKNSVLGLSLKEKKTRNC